MIITVFRARVRPELQQEYVAWVARMRQLASGMPGFISHKGFVAEDGERVSIVEFESEEAQHAWRIHPEHVAAQRKGRRDSTSNTASRFAASCANLCIRRARSSTPVTGGPVMVGTTPEQAMQFQLALGPAGGIFREAGAEAERRRPEIENALRAEMALHQQGGNVVMQSSSWTITARRPPA
jgi:heme-degrading monooxygenase HmoA